MEKRRSKIPAERKVREGPKRIPRGHIRCRRRTPPRGSCEPPGPRTTRHQQPSTETWATAEELHRARSARQGRVAGRWTTTTGWRRRSGTGCHRVGLAVYRRASLPAAAAVTRRRSTSSPVLFYTTHRFHNDRMRR